MDYEIKFGIEATTKSGIIKDIARIRDFKEDDIENIDVMLTKTPIFLLVGLQKKYKEEFGYDYDTNEGKKEALSKVYNLIDDYTDQENSSIRELFFDLVNEVMRNGFFKKELQKIEEMKNQKKAEAENPIQ